MSGKVQCSRADMVADREIWTHEASRDWNALHITLRDRYRVAAITGTAFVTGRAPPRAGNAYTMPPIAGAAPPVVPAAPMVIINAAPPVVPAAPIVIAPIVQPVDDPDAPEIINNIPDIPSNGDPANRPEGGPRPPGEDQNNNRPTPNGIDDLPDYTSDPPTPIVPPVHYVVPDNREEEGNRQAYDEHGNPIDQAAVIHRSGWNDPGVSPQAIAVPPDEEEFTLARNAQQESLLVWQKVKDLGSGGYGTVSGWVLYDTSTNNVVDRMAVKQVVTDERHWAGEENYMWFDWPTWTLPSEVVAHRILSGKNPSLVGYKGWRMYAPEKRTYRIGLALGEYGDMAKFVQHLCTTEDGDGMKEPHEITRMPVPFFLDMLACVMSAAQKMYAENMLHNDIKLANILLARDVDGAGMKDWLHADDAAASTGWGVKPLLTDFGNARPVHCQMYANPSDLLGMGTDGCRPPEQVIGSFDPATRTAYSILNHAQSNHRAIDEKAMVFSVAAAFFVVSSSSAHPSVSIYPRKETFVDAS